MPEHPELAARSPTCPRWPGRWGNSAPRSSRRCRSGNAYAERRPCWAQNRRLSNGGSQAAQPQQLQQPRKWLLKQSQEVQLLYCGYTLLTVTIADVFLMKAQYVQTPRRSSSKVRTIQGASHSGVSPSLSLSVTLSRSPSPSPSTLYPLPLPLARSLSLSLSLSSSPGHEGSVKPPGQLAPQYVIGAFGGRKTSLPQYGSASRVNRNKTTSIS